MEMETRYSPAWLPAALLAAVAIIGVLATALVVQKGKAPHKQQLVGDVVQQQHYEWKMVTTWPKNFPGLGLAPENFAKMVNTMSNGRLTVSVHGANEIVPALGVFGAVSSGSVQMGHSAAYYWKGKIPAAVFFTSVPFGMNAQELNGWLHYGGGLELWRETYAPFNLIPFAAGNTGVQMGGWFNKEINSINDLQGLKMRIPGLGGEVFSRAGGTAVNIPGGELYTSLQSGVIDATEWVGPYNDLAFGFHQIAKYYYYPGWHEPGPTLEIIVNKDAYNSLPEDLQKIIEVAARAVNQDMLDEYTARNNAALVELVEKHNVDVRPYPDDVIASLKTLSEEVFAELAADDKQFAKVYASYSDYLTKVRKYHEISEEAYFEKR
ncbi:TRAP transporter substrate-binding protein [Saccharophagus degradans]|uniref:TRAP transporter substrate-binding protein n=1 Tax=Saccharophagus degradans TaxID=86304 RepID=A0AAW7XAA4_9GAMM|nr:TRAP transporter substrate-binding protein [Saccharophagus degradans]MDO6423841.1 TRAP transporter substrate-binding protein [Saccharophagus degradans]MDO6607921.1 TRAP transporter substrate-binding protein [Saccharophagus degradans]